MRFVTNRFLARALVTILAMARPVLADDTQICRTVAIQAAADHGIPADVLLAITLTETGMTRDGQFIAWPWSTNMGGDSRRFPDAGSAIDFASQQVSAGVSNLDIGCFQLNHRWHAQGFADVAAMFDPERNAGYAAAFLARLFAETGDWTAAVGAYHSRTPEHAERYLAAWQRNLEIVRAGLPGGAPLDGITLAEVGAPARPTGGITIRAPFAPGAQPISAGSLVPLSALGS
jgi:hypothetical protein